MLVWPSGSPGGLCSLANVKLALFPTGYTDTTDDPTLQLYIDRITDEIQEYTSRQFVRDVADIDYYFDVERPNSALKVPQGIVSVTTVGIATSSQPAVAGTYTNLDPTKVLLRPLAVDRRQGFPADTIVIGDLDTVNFFHAGQNTVRVTGQFGWPAVPASIEGVALSVVVRRWQARRGGQSDTIGGGDFGGPMLRFMSVEERDTVNRYVDPGLG